MWRVRTGLDVNGLAQDVDAVDELSALDDDGGVIDASTTDVVCSNVVSR